MRRRDCLAALTASAALAACGARPSRRGDVVAAGQPAAILIHALAPDRLAGWPRRPGKAARALLGPAGALPELGALNASGKPARLDAVAALRPSLVLDYGDVGGLQLDLGEQVRDRLGVPYRLLDGDLSRTPEAIEQAGRLLDSRRAEPLARLAREVLAANAPRQPTRFYYARGSNGLETGFAGSLATEVLETRWTNVAAGTQGIARVSREAVLGWDPELIVTLDERFARDVAGDRFWRVRADGRPRRLLLLPDLPFGWIDRPPSLNRLVGLAWLHARDWRGVADALYGPRVGERLPEPRWL